MEFSEIALRKAIDNLEKSSQNFETTLKHQEDIINKLPYADKNCHICILLLQLILD